jgi:hypothetical protein
MQPKQQDSCGPHNTLVQLFLFGIQNMMFGPYLAAIHRIHTFARPVVQAAVQRTICLLLQGSRNDHATTGGGAVARH